MTTPYRAPGPLAKLAPPAPWWRLLWAQATRGVLSRLMSRRFRHRYGIVRDPAAWAQRGLVGKFTDEEIDRFLPPSLRKVPRAIRGCHQETQPGLKVPEYPLARCWCARTVHAEANALVQAARNGVRVDGSTAYVTAFPCWNCFKLLVQAGVVRIMYREPYRPDPKVLEVAAGLKLALDHVP